MQSKRYEFFFLMKQQYIILIHFNALIYFCNTFNWKCNLGMGYLWLVHGIENVQVNILGNFNKQGEKYKLKKYYI